MKRGLFFTARIRRSYLVKFIDPDKTYPVTYTIKQDGTKSYGITRLSGRDLTENQIVDLFKSELI